MSIKVKREREAPRKKRLYLGKTYQTCGLTSPQFGTTPQHPPTHICGWVGLFLGASPSWTVNRSSLPYLWNYALFREASFRLVPPLCEHCPNSNYTPPSRTQTGTLGHFFSGAILPFYHFVYHFLWISAPNHPGKGLDPPKIKQMPIWTWKILL